MKDSSILFTGAQAEQQTRQNRRRSGRISDWIAEYPALAAFPFVLCAALLLWRGLSAGRTTRHLFCPTQARYCTRR